MGGRDVADSVIIVSRVDASRELQSKFGEDMRSRPALVYLCLMLEARELSLESKIPMIYLAHRAAATHQKLTLAQRCKDESRPVC